MGKVIQGPWSEEVNESDIWQTLVYNLWMDEYYPLFVEAGKIKRSYVTYGNLIESFMELAQEGYIEYDESDEGYQIKMNPKVHELIHEAVIVSFNMSKTDEEINQLLD